MSVKKFMAELMKHDAANKRDYDPHANVLRFSSPGLNFLFGNAQGLPLGYSAVFWGPDKSGKTQAFYDMLAQLHKDDPEAIGIRFDTEQRDQLQMTPTRMRTMGIDPDRYVCIETAKSDGIFDWIENQVVALCQKGAKIKLICIDSITDIIGRRAEEAEGIKTVQRGDDAATQKDGLKRIREVIRKYKICLVLTDQVRAEQDPIEVLKGNKFKPASSWYVKHYVEYWIRLEQWNSKEGRKDILGKELVGVLQDGLGKAEQTGHMVRAKMTSSSAGPKNRQIYYRLDYQRGIVGQHEEVFTLACNRGIIQRPTNTAYVVPNYPEGKDSKYIGKAATVTAIERDENLFSQLVQRLRAQDVDVLLNGAASPYYGGNADIKTIKDNGETEGDEEPNEAAVGESLRPD